jgi:hypothetical protein
MGVFERGPADGKRACGGLNLKRPTLNFQRSTLSFMLSVGSS